MSNLPKMSNRAKTALDILGDGGCFNYALVRNGFTGREQFQWCLRTRSGGVVKGFGHSTYHELNNLGFMGHGKPNGFTGSSTSYYLNATA